MSKLVIAQVPGVDGSYEFDFEDRLAERGWSALAATELEFIVFRDTYEEAFDKGDNDMMVALALIVLKRHGKVIPHDALWDAPAGCLTFGMDDVAEDDAVPPPSGPAVNVSDSAPSDPSAKTSSAIGDDLLETGPRTTGTPVSAIGRTSDPMTSPA